MTVDSSPVVEMDIYELQSQISGLEKSFYDMVAKSIGDDTNNKQLLILPFDN